MNSWVRLEPCGQGLLADRHPEPAYTSRFLRSPPLRGACVALLFRVDLQLEDSYGNRWEFGQWTTTSDDDAVTEGGSVDECRIRGARMGNANIRFNLFEMCMSLTDVQRRHSQGAPWRPAAPDGRFRGVKREPCAVADSKCTYEDVEP